MAAWLVTYEGHDPGQERLREGLCTLGNGYFATRGAMPESAAGMVRYPGTYVAGRYDRLPSRISGRSVVNEDLANVTDWFPIVITLAGRTHWSPALGDGRIATPEPGDVRYGRR